MSDKEEGFNSPKTWLLAAVFLAAGFVARPFVWAWEVVRGER